MMKQLLHIVLVFYCCSSIVNAQNLSMVYDINPFGSESSSNPSNFFIFNDKLYFSAKDSRLIDEYWEYDGIGDPVIVKDFIPQLDNMLPLYLTAFNNKIYFHTYIKIDTSIWFPLYYDIKIWEYDGSNYPHLLISYTGSQHKFPSELVVYNNKLYFNAFDTAYGEELWVYDGSNDPMLVKDIYPGFSYYEEGVYEERKKYANGSRPHHLTVFKNCLYFCGYHSDNQLRLWVYDGTNDPALMKDNMGNPVFYPSELKVFNNKLYFCAHDTIHGSELWAYDGINNPALEIDIYPGFRVEEEGKHIANNSSPSNFTVFKNTLYFCANNGIHGKELMAFDGINDPELVKDIRQGTNSSSPSIFTEFNNKLYFVANDGGHGFELWKYDGISEPVMVSDILAGTLGSHPLYLTVFNDKLYFSADDGGHGRELWEYDGINRPAMLKDICIRSNSSSPSGFKVFNNKLFFQAFDGPHGEELWEYDGTNNPILVKDINPYNNNYGPRNLCVFNERLYFSADNGIDGEELWRFDGAGEPVMVKDICTGSCDSRPLNLTVFNNKMYFIAQYNTLEHVLWVNDGAGDLRIVSDIPKGFGGSGHSEFTVFNNKLIFMANDGWHGFELWEYDGITNPILVKDINPGIDGSYPSEFTLFKNKLYFTANKDTIENAPTLWEYNGSNEPAMAFSGWEGIEITDLCVFNNKLYFSATDKIYGKELWEYDGTVDPVLVKDIYPGYFSFDGFKKFAYRSNPSDLAVYNNKLYFSADDGIHGKELWEYNGIEEPALVEDIFPGSSGSSPSEFTVFNNKLYFSANDEEHGRELWVYEPIEITSPGIRNDFGASLILYPNPFSVSTVISYELPKAGEVQLEILNILGEKITTLVNESQNPGSYKVTWNAAGAKPGIYFCKLKTDDFEKVSKLVISR